MTKKPEFNWLDGSKVTVGEFSVFFSQTKISKDGKPIKVEPLVMELLCYLIARRGEYVNQRDLLENVWDGRYVSDNAVRRVIKKLRDALNDNPKDPHYIKTVPSKGYLLIAPVTITEPVINESPATSQHVSSDENKGVISDSVIEEAALKQTTKRVPPKYLILGIILLAALIGLATKFSPMPADSIKIEVITQELGEEGWPDFNPSAGIKVFSHRASSNENFELFLQESNRSVLRQITQGNANNYSAKWSNDGKSLAFQRQRGETVEIVVADLNDNMTINNSEVVFSYDTMQPGLDWYPGENKIVFVHHLKKSHPYSFFSIDISTKELNQFTFPDVEGAGDYAGEFSPNGDYFALLRFKRNDRVHLIVVNLINGKITADVKLDSAPISIAWGQDNQNIFMVNGKKISRYSMANNEFFHIDVANRHINSIHSHCGENCLLAIEHNKSRDIKERINPWSAEDSTNIDAFRLSRKGNDRYPVYSYDGKTVVFIAKPNNINQIVKYTIYGETEVLTEFTEDFPISHIQYHPTEKKIIGLLDQQIFILDLETRALSYITTQMEGAMRPNWSKDGSHIYYSRHQQNDFVLIKHHVSNNVATKLASGVIEGKESINGQLLFLLKTDGTLLSSPIDNVQDSKKLTTISSNSNVSWALFEDYIYYSLQTGNDFYLHRYDINSGAENKVPWLKNSYNAKFDIHPSGKKFLLTQKNRIDSNVVKLTGGNL